jgi:hypothetical protein
MIYAATDDVSRCGMCSSRTSRVFRSTRVPMADCCSFPMMRSPSVASARSGLRAGMAARISSEYEITWRQLAAVLGTRAPWFPSELRDRDAIAVWQPGDLPTIAAALPGRGLSWGYGGSGPHALAALLNRLHDTNGRPADLGDNPPEGLLDLIAETPQDGTTTYAGQAAIGAPIRLIAESSSPAADCRRRVSWRAS